VEDISNRTIEKVYKETKEFLVDRKTSFIETVSDFYLPYVAVYESLPVKKKLESSINSYLKENNLNTKYRFTIKNSIIVKRNDENQTKNVIFTIPTNIEYRVGVGTSKITSKRKQFNITFNNSGIVLERNYFENINGYNAFVCDGNPINNSFNVKIKFGETFVILRQNADKLKTTLENVAIITDLSKGFKKVTVKNEYENLLSFELELNTNKEDNLLYLNLKCTINNKTYYIKILSGRLYAYYFINDIKINLLENPNEIKRFYNELMKSLDKASLSSKSSYDLLILKRVFAYFFDCIAKHREFLSPYDLTVRDISTVQKNVIEHVKNLESAIPVPYFRERIHEIDANYKKSNYNTKIIFHKKDN
jgi:hypothetical protein